MYYFTTSKSGDEEIIILIIFLDSNRVFLFVLVYTILDRNYKMVVHKALF